MAASEKQLGTLHARVATALDEQVQGYIEVELNAAGEQVQRLIRPSPALLGAAIAFLKNNNVTADADENTALKTLRDTLQAKRKKSASASALDEAAMAYATSVGGGSLQ